MPTPGVDVTLLKTASAISVASDSGTAFITGTTDRGPLTPVLIGSLAQFVQVFGARQTYSILYDWVDEFFREGGNEVYVSRVVGPNPTLGTRNLLDAGSGISLVVNANGPGSWSSSYKVQVIAGSVGGAYQINITDASNNVLENSGDLFDQQSAVNWSQNSQYVRIVLGVTALVPATVAATALTAGNDDRSNITDTQWLNAQNLFTSDLGPGQVCQPGRTTSTAYSQLTTHADNYNRVCILDLTDSPTAATLLAAVSAVVDEHGAAFAPWVQMPGVSGTVGLYRTVPPSALVCGLIARNDPSLGPNRPAAGPNGFSNYAVGLSQPAWDDNTRKSLNTGKVNVIRNLRGGIRVYGWRSLADPINDPSWVSFGNSRLYMALAYDLDAAAENYLFDDIDGQNGTTINSFHDALVGVLMEYFNGRQLFGATPEEAFAVDTGSNVNTLATIAALELHAVCFVKMAPFAEHIPIQIVKRQVTENIV